MRERWTSRGLLAISGLLMGLSVTFGHLFGFLSWFCLIPALAVLFRMRVSVSGRGKFRRLWLAGLWLFWPMELIIFHWFWYLFPLSFVGLSTGASLVVVLVAWLGLSGMQAVGMALIFPLCSLVLQLWETRWPAMRVVLWPLVVAALWTLAEWCQTLFWFGVPWGRLALSQASYLPIMQTVSVWGCYGLTFLMVAVNGYLCLAIKDIVEHTGRFKRWLCTALSFFAVNLVLGSVLLYVNDHREPEREIYAVAVQGNFESGSKWDATAFDIWERYRGLTLDAVSAHPADLIVWPETAMPFVLQDYPTYVKRAMELAEKTGGTLMTGTFTRDEAGTEYSSVEIFLPDGTQSDTVYSKRRLVPFGEFVPLKSVITACIPPLADLNLWENDLGTGTEATVAETSSGKVGFLLCFDSIYETLTRDTVRNGADILVLPTNDSWFFDSAAIYMHCAQAKLRAVESGRSIVRAANTGISALITPSGRMVASLGPNRRGVAAGQVGLFTHWTPYMLLGNLAVLMSFLFLLTPFLGCGIAFIRKKRAVTCLLIDKSGKT